jgi:hypothetical protein
MMISNESGVDSIIKNLRRLVGELETKLRYRCPSEEGLSVWHHSFGADKGVRAADET